MSKAIIGFLSLLLLSHVALADTNFSWDGTYEYSEGGDTVTGMPFIYKRTIKVIRTAGGKLIAEVHDDGRMTTGEIILCDAHIDSANKSMLLTYRGIKYDEAGPVEAKEGEFMKLTRVMVNGEQLFSVEGNFYPENPQPFFVKIRPSVAH